MLPRTEMKRTKPAYILDEERYKRFPVTNQAFVRVSYEDAGELGYNLWLDKMMGNMARRVALGEEGRLQQDNAMDIGANVLNLLLGNYGFPNYGYLKWNPMFAPEMFTHRRVELPAEKLTEMVKSAAELYGADLTGVAVLNPKWIFSDDMTKPFVFTDGENPEETEEAFLIPKSINRAVVMAVAMDGGMIEESPKIAASMATSIGYSRMGIAAVTLAEYIRSMGYHAIPCMNDTALSVPLAIDAGLGELGRHGILITPEYGSSVRLCKVLTDMPLIADEPIDTGIAEFCAHCLLCAKDCPSKAISYGEPTMEGPEITGNAGTLKWYIDGTKCLKFWQLNGASCANCIAACPFTSGFLSIHCFECEKCETTRGCELQANTHKRIKYGYLKNARWGEKSEMLRARRLGL